MPVGGDKGLLIFFCGIESFIQEIPSKMLIHPVTLYWSLWVNQWIIHSNCEKNNENKQLTKEVQLIIIIII